MKRSEPEYWRDIPGFGGLYQASTEGRIRKVWPKSGKATVMTPFTKPASGSQATRNALRVRLTAPNGKRVEYTVLKLIAETFFGVPKGMIAVHRNGLKIDNSVRNIMILSNRDTGRRYGSMSKRRPVIKINRDGKIVDCYASARQAARANNMSYQTVMDRCNNKVKRPYELDGHNYQWESKIGE